MGRREASGAIDGAAPFIPYPPIGAHGVIGDRRTAGLVAADGTLDWLCLPRYDGEPLFGALIDAKRGGFWRAGPSQPTLGQQRYADDSAVLVTRWETDAWALELTDAMAWPWDNRDARHGGPDGRCVLRRLRSVRGTAPATVAILPRVDFGAPLALAPATDGATAEAAGKTLTLWTSRPAAVSPHGLTLAVEIQPGEELWSLLAWGEETPRPWTTERACETLDETLRFWAGWAAELDCDDAARERVLRSAVTIHLLNYAPTGSPVASPTTSLPERIGGDRNWDYRYAWVRDAALSIATLSRLGELKAGRRYMDCLASYDSSTDSPLQVVYGVDGALDLPECERWELAGYADSQPVRIGNRACSQRQLDSLGFFVDCAAIYLENGGEWTADHWEMVRRAAEYTLGNWTRPDSGIWEKTDERHYVSSKVMSWVGLDRAVAIADRLGHGDEAAAWRPELDVIHAEVMACGWSERRRAFCQAYDDDTLDASALLMPIVGFLPVDHPRVVATVERIMEELTIDGFVYRYTPDEDCPPLGQYEGAFLPATFWLATVQAMAGRRAEAEAILARVEAVAGGLGLFAEEVDARSRLFLGNMPLLFAHAEYVRAVMTLEAQRPPSAGAGP